MDIKANVVRRRLLLGTLVALATTHVSAQTAPSGDNYRLAPGDMIKVVVFQNPDLTLETRVSEDATIRFPLIGDITVGNLGISAAERRTADALEKGGYLKKPQVSIQLVEIRGNKISVLGQVNKPGAYPLETFNMRVAQMLAQAGGISPIGDDAIILTGTRDGKPFRKQIDVDSLYREDRPDQNVVLAGGDSIYVPRAPMFYIYGEVQKPGTYRLDRNMTVRQAIAAGGGITLRGTERRLKVDRRNAAGALERIPVELNDPVKPEDTIYVTESIF